MSHRSTSISPLPFEGTLRVLERWRRGREPGARIPEEIWRRAVRLARKEGISRTARALRVGFYELRERVERGRAPESAAVPTGRNGSRFLEIPLALSRPAPPPEGLLELEDAGRGRLRVELRGPGLSRIESLARALWRGGSR
jgi:hypothetical protein